MRPHTTPRYLQPSDGDTRALRFTTLVPLRAMPGERNAPNTTFALPLPKEPDDVGLAPLGMKSVEEEQVAKPKVYDVPKSVFVFYAPSRAQQRKRGRDPVMANVPKPVLRLLDALPAAVGCVGVMEPLLYQVPSTAFLMEILQKMAPPPPPPQS